MSEIRRDEAHPDACSDAGNERDDGQSAILEWFAIFHPWDFITATRARGKPDWFTEVKYPLYPQSLYNRWCNPNEFVGVRFNGKKDGSTSYALLDIDIGSAFHPKYDPNNFLKILEALDDIGLCRQIVICSSHSDGLHVYLPLPKAFNCYKVAAALQICLEKADFEVKDGQLECFPNVKAPRSLFKAHRLPLQTGSYVLDAEFNHVHNSIDKFIDSWNIAANGQDLDAFEQAITQAKFSRPYMKGDPAEWKERLEQTLEQGWTSAGQTNRILKEICIYARVFQGLEWDEVARWVLSKVQELPGYETFCNHRRHLKRRINDWVKTNRKSHRYYPYGQAPKRKTSNGPTNEEKEQDALARIKTAIAQIKADGQYWPNTVRDRQQLICKTAQCSAGTLYKYRVLWHPDFESGLCVTNHAATDSAISTGDSIHPYSTV